MSTMHNVKFTFRLLRKSPGFTATAVLMLALGIGATTAIFSVVQGVLLRPLPFPESGRLVMLSDILEGVEIGMQGEAGVTGPDIIAYARDTQGFESLGGYTQTSYELSGVGEPATINAARLTGGVFPALRVAPLLGRVFTQQEDDQRQQVAVLSHAAWQKRFHGDAGVLGSKILLDRKPYIVIGVMPRNFEFPLVPGQLNHSELWTPMSFQQDEISGGAAGSWNYKMVGRLKPGTSLPQAQADANRVAKEITRGFPSFMSSLHMSAVVRPLQEDTVEQARPLIHTLFLAVAVVLLIACANLAGLLLIRAMRRRREIAVRLALGARATVLIRQAVMEGLVLSLSGGLLGLGLAAIALRVGRSLLPETLPLISQIGLDWYVAVFALLLAIFTGLICSLAPAFTAIRTNMNAGLKEGGRSGTTGSGHARLRSTLVVVEIAIAVVLLCASGVLLRSFEKMRAVPLGFRPDHTLTAAYSLPQSQYSSQASVDRFNKQVLDRLQSLPGVTAAAMSSLLPASSFNGGGAFLVEGYVPANGTALSLAWQPQVIGDYFRALGIPLLRGRTFTEADDANAQLVIIVNRKISEHYWPGQDPIGKRIRWGLPETPSKWMTVVGEVEDVKQGSPDNDTSEQIYQPVSQLTAALPALAGAGLSGNSGYIVLRTTLPPEQMQNAMLAAVRSIDPQLPLTQVQTVEHAVASIEAPRRFNTGLITAFAAAAVLLAVLGIYSIITFSAALRTQEMAIRMALGAQRTGVLGLILMSGAKLALVGCALGLAGAFLAGRLLRTFLFGVSPFDPLVLASSAAAILLLALIVSVFPARRAAAIDPMQALRAE
jgi:putative ABC transport system permease protein